MPELVEIETTEEPSSTELTSQTDSPRAIPQQSDSLLSTIITMAKDPSLDIEKFKALLELQKQMEIRQAEVEFSRALARLSAKMPHVPKNGRVSLGTGKGSYPFAKWEDMNRLIRPLMAEEGFTLSFTSAVRDDDRITITGTLIHKDGCTRSSGVVLPPDTGPGRNNLQAMGSALSYGKRYTAEMLLNIVREGEDNDGASDAPYGSFGGAKTSQVANRATSPAPKSS